MSLVCTLCGEYSVQGTREKNALYCFSCEQEIEANILPLIIITGASGSGKTTITQQLRSKLDNCVIFDKDLLYGRWGESGSEDLFRNNWLRIAYSIAQEGRYTVVLGTFTPENFDNCEDRKLVGDIHFINLHCTEEERIKRLKQRPTWRDSCNDDFINQQNNFAKWLIENAKTKFNPPLTTIDTTFATIEEVVDKVNLEIKKIISEKNLGVCHTSPAS